MPELKNNGLKIKMFPCRSDNYGFLVHDPVSGQTASIDTPDPDVIMQEAQAAGWTLTHIFNTHHHFDHVGGNKAIKDALGVTIIGPRAEASKIPHIDIAVGEGDTAALGHHKAAVFDTPAHTLGHIAYHFADDAVIFVGDTLFALGCGRLFEGTPAMMWAAMQKFAALPDATQVYCAHEYTLSNAAFALSVDGANPALIDYVARAKALREKGLPTVPTTIGAEKAANPFMRADTPALRKSVNMMEASAADVLGEIRRRKDAF
ncbi:MAG: hydroxyacylglutathione hydrolase [Robiginitomaculum sp.]